jgi:branched-chain amino acid transport system permease protein
VAIFTVPLAERAKIFYITPQNPVLAQIELPFVAALLLGGFLAALVAIMIGVPVLRLKSDYLAIATLGFSEIIRIVFTNIKSITYNAYHVGFLRNSHNFHRLYAAPDNLQLRQGL